MLLSAGGAVSIINKLVLISPTVISGLNCTVLCREKDEEKAAKARVLAQVGTAPQYPVLTLS